MNLLQELSSGKSYADFIQTNPGSSSASRMTDRRSPVPPGSQGSGQTAEPSRDYDIIDEEAITNTAHHSGASGASACGSALKNLSPRNLLDQVSSSLTRSVSPDKIFRRGPQSGEYEDGGGGSQELQRPSQGQGGCWLPVSRATAGDGNITRRSASEGMPSAEQHSHGNGMGFGSVTPEDQGTPVPALNLPRVNCPEKIIICIDLAVEVNRVPFVASDGTKQLPLELVKKALNMFVQTKSALNPNHEFALVLLQETALWIQDLTSDVDDFVNVLLDMTNDTTECESCGLTSLFDVIHDKVQVPDIEDIECVPPPYVIRTLFVYGRSRCIPRLGPPASSGYCESQKTLSSSPYFFFDVFYVHEPPTEENFCKEIYDVFLNLDVHNTSYIHEVGRDKAKLQEKMAMLVAHPLQRPPQTQCSYNIFQNERSVASM